MSGGIRLSQNQSAATWDYSITEGGESIAYYPGIVLFDQGGAAPGFNNVAVVAGTDIPAPINMIVTKGYYAPGDGGGAIYVRVGAPEPGSIQSADGQDWGLIWQIGYNIRQFGAVVDGVTDDTVAITTAIAGAIANGYIIDGGNELAAVSGNIQITGDYLSIHNLNLIQLAPDNVSRRTLFFTGCNYLDLKNIYVNRNGDGTGGSLANAAGIWIAGGNGHRIEGIEVEGDDKGTGLAILSTTNSDIRLVYVHSIAYDDATAVDDQVQGIWFNANAKMTATDLHVTTLTGNGDVSFPNRYTRGIAVAGNLHCVYSSITVEEVDQGIDFSGSAGNEDCEIGDFTIKNVTTWGLKYANSQIRCVAGDGTIENAGLAGVVFSGPAEAGLTNKCSDCVVDSVTVINPGYNAFPGTTQGFLIDPSAFDVDFPKGIKIRNCLALDIQAIPTMDYGFRCAVASAPGNNRLNELIDCRSYGYITSHSLGFNFNICQVNGDTDDAIASDANWHALNWPGSDLIDGASMHNAAVSNNVITIRQSGIYLISHNIAWQNNAAGNRAVRILKSNSPVTGGLTRVAPVTGAQTYVCNSIPLRLAAGDFVSLEGQQNSGGPLNFERDKSTFSVMLLEAVGE